VSSRRRHTRSKRDWSSHVCAADLPPAVITNCQKLFLGRFFHPINLIRYLFWHGKVPGLVEKYLVGLPLFQLFFHIGKGTYMKVQDRKSVAQGKRRGGGRRRALMSK